MVDQLRELISVQGPAVLTLSGLLIGIAFGAIVARTGFCAMGAINDRVTLGDGRRLRAWLLAAATALIGAQLLDAANVTDLHKSLYLIAPINWLGYLVGGLIFGIGMVFAGGCISKNLVRAGAGDLRSLVNLGVVALFTHITLGGVLGPARVAMANATQLTTHDLRTVSQSLPDLLAASSLVPSTLSQFPIAFIVATAIAAYCFSSTQFRNSSSHVFAGVGIGTCVVAGWAATGLAYDEFAHVPRPPASLTFVGPTGDTFEWLRRATALAPFPGFAIAAVIGTMIGSFLHAISTRHFTLATFNDTPDTVRNLTGAAMMGIGGVLGLGCTIGQAITGVSTLALGSFITFAAIATGAVLGIKLLERWS